MRRALYASVVLAVLAAMTLTMVGAASGSTTYVPRWVKHVRNYPGGLDGTVRASLKRGVINSTSPSNRAT